MPSLQVLSDRYEIESVMIDYVNAIDTRNFDALDDVFTADADIDYRAMGGMAGKYPQVKRWLAEVLPNFTAYYHLIGNISIRVDGDRAHSRSACFNPMQMTLPGGEAQVMFLGLWYIDEWLRTEAGWRITRRVEEKCFDHNVPPALKAAVGSAT